MHAIFVKTASLYVVFEMSYESGDVKPNLISLALLCKSSKRNSTAPLVSNDQQLKIIN